MQSSASDQAPGGQGGGRGRTLAIVIVNWNAGPLLADCLNSIRLASAPAGWRIAHVVVVDNASTDGSAERLVPDEPLPLQVIRNERNRGFGAACNQGAAAVHADLLLLLNPDTRLFEESLHAPIGWLEDPAHQDVGIVGIPLVDAQGHVDRCCARFPRVWHFASQAVALDRLLPATGHLMREWPHDRTRRVDQVIGAFFLVRKPLWDALGGFDERFFVYFEEVDFALRASQRGQHSVFVAESRAFHLGGGSSGQVKALRLFYSLRSRLQYAEKHLGTAETLALKLVTWTVEPLARSLHLLLRGRARETWAVAQGYVHLLQWQWNRLRGGAQPQG